MTTSAATATTAAATTNDRDKILSPRAAANPSAKVARYPIAISGSDQAIGSGSTKYIHIQSGATTYEMKAVELKATAVTDPALNARDRHGSSGAANRPNNRPMKTRMGQSMMKVFIAPSS